MNMWHITAVDLGFIRGQGDGQVDVVFWTDN